MKIISNHVSNTDKSFRSYFQALSHASAKPEAEMDGAGMGGMAHLDEDSLEEVAYSEAVELNKPNKTRLDDPMYAVPADMSDIDDTMYAAPEDMPVMDEAEQGELPQGMTVDSDQPGE